MEIILLVVFAFSLFYLSMAERFRTYTALIALQGLLLFGLACFRLREMNVANLVFLVTETLLFKAIAVPFLMYRILNRIQVNRVHPDALPGFYALLLTMAGLLLSIFITRRLDGQLIERTFMLIAMLALFTGVILIITHRRIFSHLVGFLVIENAVFLFSLAVGMDAPYLVNIGVLLDIVVSILILGLFMGRIGTRYSDMETDNLADLKH
ncbi:MAG TPA: hypothetical protein P5531_01910 [Bacteroidales bacterium]|nr:hypothetical protein [Bacteroidales bacterium]HSA43048.1 hypothetical protein [Bacteroidales bacterium]